jgi:putative nucleotidyltransferase with HDIG domain
MELTRAIILERIRKAKKLPAYPEVILKVEEELARPEPRPNVLARIIEQDPAVVARLLRVANSALHGSNTTITQVQQAVLRLGLSQTHRLAVACAVAEEWKSVNGLDRAGFWGHALAVALASRAICELSPAALPNSVTDAAYVAGLLHDIGALVLGHLFPNEYRQLAQELAEVGGPSVTLERSLWEIDHSEAGAVLAQGWRLPSSIVDVIRNHHTPWLAAHEHRALVDVVHIADFVCNNQGFGRADAGFPDAFDAGSWDALMLSLEQVPLIISRVRQQGEESVVLARTLTDA